jgi:hypothetical protein
MVVEMTVPSPPVVSPAGGPNPWSNSMDGGRPRIVFWSGLQGYALLQPVLTYDNVNGNPEWTVQVEALEGGPFGFNIFYPQPLPGKKKGKPVKVYPNDRLRSSIVMQPTLLEEVYPQYDVSFEVWREGRWHDLFPAFTFPGNLSDWNATEGARSVYLPVLYFNQAFPLVLEAYGSQSAGTAFADCSFFPPEGVFSSVLTGLTQGLWDGGYVDNSPNISVLGAVKWSAKSQCLENNGGHGPASPFCNVLASAPTGDGGTSTISWQYPPPPGSCMGT